MLDMVPGRTRSAIWWRGFGSGSCWASPFGLLNEAAKVVRPARRGKVDSSGFRSICYLTDYAMCESPQSQLSQGCNAPYAPVAIW